MTDHEENARLARICRQALDALDHGLVIVAVEILEQERRRQTLAEEPQWYPRLRAQKSAHTSEHNASDQHD